MQDISDFFIIENSRKMGNIGKLYYSELIQSIKRVLAKVLRFKKITLADNKSCCLC